MPLLPCAIQDAMSERLVKEGWCKQCSRSDIGVSWHPGSRAWYCVDCWPALKEKKQHEERRESRMPTWHELQRLRDQMYGYRTEDDPRSPGDFVAICPEHGVIAGGLTVVGARRERDNHELSHPVRSPL